ncbi:hypothetical protein VTL71DRAFT_12762 [Oculimacula yallundae]|uniref:Uncharacterized protein n=1 Tax=Oculimacula yallundae TaxID=86028 RepID=A0ABR4CNF2_9HELO
MIRQTTPDQLPETITVSRSASSDSRGSKARQYVSKGRWWLAGIAILMVIAMIIGIIFAAHVYYHSMGGQGFLKVRRQQPASKDDDGTQLYLPMRRMEYVAQERSIWGLIGRSPKNIPFYTCGDQLNSCESFNQPDICCPVTMACYRASFTPSGIYCCNSSISQFDCEPSKDNPPTCMDGTVQCSEATGGGCCPSVSECSPNGCIHVVSASILSTTATSAIGSKTTGTHPTPSATRNSVSPEGTPLSTVTIIQQPAATQTLAKSGEVMQARGAKGSIVTILSVPHSTACLLVGVAALMGLL